MAALSSITFLRIRYGQHNFKQFNTGLSFLSGGFSVALLLPNHLKMGFKCQNERKIVVYARQLPRKILL